MAIIDITIGYWDGNRSIAESVNGIEGFNFLSGGVSLH